MTDAAHKPLGPLLTRGWLADQPEPFRDFIFDAGQIRRCPRGKALFEVGDAADALYGLVEGALAISLPLSGAEPLTLHRATPGFWIGESALLGGSVRTVSVHAAADSTVFRVPASAIRTALERDPGFWPCFYALSHHNASLAMMVYAEAMSLTPRARLARILLRLMDEDGRVKATQGELAELIGMTRSSLQRALGELKAAGAVHQEFAALTVTDVDRLRGLEGEV